MSFKQIVRGEEPNKRNKRETNNMDDESNIVRNKRNKRETNDMDDLLNAWMKLNEGDYHLEIPETQGWGKLDDQTRASLTGKWEKKKITDKDIDTWIHESIDMVHEPNKQPSDTGQKIKHDKSNIVKSPVLNAITETPTTMSSDLSITEPVRFTLKNIKKDNVISLPGGDTLHVIDRTITHAIFKNNIMEAYFVFNHDMILIGKGVNTEATWVTQKYKGDEYIWVKYKLLVGKMGSKKLADNEISGAEDLEVQGSEQDKMIYISNMMYYTKEFSE